MQDELTYETLEAKRLANEDAFQATSTSIGVRARRCISWLGRAEQEMKKDDPDAAFIFYWIAFNAAYSEGSADTRSETEKRDDFLNEVVELDNHAKVHNAIWVRYQGPIRSLLTNKYVYEPFWRNLSGWHGYEDWKTKFRIELWKVRTALGNQDTSYILRILCSRLYVLRNQLIHGCATWNGSVNRAQVKDGARIMDFLVPLFIDLMMSNPEIDWGEPPYPP